MTEAVRSGFSVSRRKDPLDVAAVSVDPTRKLSWTALPPARQAISTRPGSERPSCRLLRACSGVSGSCWYSRAGAVWTGGAVAADDGLPEGLVVGIVRGRSVGHAADAWAEAQTAMQFCGLLGIRCRGRLRRSGLARVLAQLPAEHGRGEPRRAGDRRDDHHESGPRRARDARAAPRERLNPRDCRRVVPPPQLRPLPPPSGGGVPRLRSRGSARPAACRARAHRSGGCRALDRANCRKTR